MSADIGNQTYNAEARVGSKKGGANIKLRDVFLTVAVVLLVAFAAIYIHNVMNRDVGILAEVDGHKLGIVESQSVVEDAYRKLKGEVYFHTDGTVNLNWNLEYKVVNTKKDYFMN